jgi:hypothetical protein
MIEGFPLRGLSFRPSNPSSLYLLYQLLAHNLDPSNPYATNSICCLSDSACLIRRILSLTQHHVRPCMLCLLLRLSTSNKL